MSIINGDSDFTNRTTEANNLWDDIKENGFEINTVNEIIRLREEALEIYVSRNLYKLLAEDYRCLARLYLAERNWNQAYESYIKSIEYEVSYIELISDINEFYLSIYRIAIVYQDIGDIPAMDVVIRKEAYYLSACAFEIVYDRLIGNDEITNIEEFSFKSSYYAGMTNHKLILLSKESEGGGINYYINDALKYYENSLVFYNYKKQRRYQYNYIVQICEIAQDYVKQYGVAENMLKKDQYEEKESMYKALILKLP